MTFLHKKQSTSKIRQHRPPPILTNSAPTTPVNYDKFHSSQPATFTPTSAKSTQFQGLTATTSLPPTPTSPLTRMFRWSTRKSSGGAGGSASSPQLQFHDSPPQVSKEFAKAVVTSSGSLSRTDSVSSTCTTNSQSSFFADTYIAKNSPAGIARPAPSKIASHMSASNRENIPPVKRDGSTVTNSSPLKPKGKHFSSAETNYNRSSNAFTAQSRPKSAAIFDADLASVGLGDSKGDTYYYARVASPPSKFGTQVSGRNQTRHARKRSNSFGGVPTPVPSDLAASKMGRFAEHSGADNFATYGNSFSANENERRSIMLVPKPEVSLKKSSPVIQRAVAIRDKYLTGKKPQNKSPPMIVPTLCIVPATPDIDKEEFSVADSRKFGPSLAEQVAQRMMGAQVKVDVKPEPNTLSQVIEEQTTGTPVYKESDQAGQQHSNSNRNSTCTILPVKVVHTSFSPAISQSNEFSSPQPHDYASNLYQTEYSTEANPNPLSTNQVSETAIQYSKVDSNVTLSQTSSVPALSNSSSVSSLNSIESHAFSDASDTDDDFDRRALTPKYNSPHTHNTDLQRSLTHISTQSELDCEEQLESMLASLSCDADLIAGDDTNSNDDFDSNNQELVNELEMKLQSNFGIMPLEIPSDDIQFDFGLPQIPSILEEKGVSSWFLAKSGSSSSSLSKRAGGYVTYLPAATTPPLTPDTITPVFEAANVVEEVSAGDESISENDPSTPKFSDSLSQHLANSQSIAYTKAMAKNFSSSQLPWLYESSDAESLSESFDEVDDCLTDDEEVATVQTGIRLYPVGADIGLAL